MTVNSLSGFAPQYQNDPPDFQNWNGDQTHHFAAFFRVGYNKLTLSGKPALTFEGAEAFLGCIKKLVGGRPEAEPLNQSDVQLGDLAQRLGQQMANGTLAGSQPWDAIRSQLCAN
jgi:hypothetical protein